MRHVLFSAFGFEVFSAPVFAGLAGLAAFLCLKRMNAYMRLTEEDFWNLVLVLVLGVPAGAVLFYVIFYGMGLGRNLSVLRAGGLPGGSFWGSLWASAAAAYVYCRFRKLDFRPVADGLGLSAMIALAVMRIGCFLHGCCYGAETSLPWAVRFYDPRCAAVKVMGAGVPLHPSQLYESGGSLAIFLLTGFLFSRGKLRPGAAFALSVALYSVLRFAVDFTRGGDAGMLPLGPLTTAQLIAAASAAGCAIWYTVTERHAK